MKHLAGENLAETLGRLWATLRPDALLQHNPQVVVPVPLYRWRRWHRGYNQSEAVARGLAKVLKLPLNRWVLRRIRQTPRQTDMTAEGRRENVAGAFLAGHYPSVGGMRVLLVDDVLTTGATADAASTALLAVGAAQVHVAVLAHR